MLIWPYLEVVTLPNGFTLHPQLSPWKPDHMHLYAPGGGRVPSRVEKVLWCNQIVYGVRTFEEKAFEEEVFSTRCGGGTYPTVTEFFLYDRRERSLQGFEMSRECALPNAEGVRFKRTPKARHEFARALEKKGIFWGLDLKRAVSYQDIMAERIFLDKTETCRKPFKKKDASGLVSLGRLLPQ